jgi:hypothetical protein
MSEEVSQLERAPDSLRSAVDPALEAHQHQDHMQSDGYEASMQHHIEHLANESLDHTPHHPTIDELSAAEHQEPFSPRRGFTHKRQEEPPRNSQGKYLCKFQQTCSSLTFDRRCEWR